ncbi:hypothetical protein BFJ68_g9878 [Fusarium oxysporum]|uniref:Uncharacterized protein n=1 Tax=Fusarium oxysporum TaxID=5507 RepID=A0A420PP87_FUSOX|nr:hypothetical protein BFJ71_g9031 [Fusarium oxysporum]RKL07375.1 hypothetical protein BFJ68_g9878 [Fusarium oxysporum]
MGNKYTIRINKNTGSDQNYNLLSEKPEISGVSKSNIWANVHQSNESCTDGATAEFEVWKTYHGIVGTWRGGAMDGDNFFIGVAGSPDGASSAPIATFRPEPGSQYQIHPSNVFFISAGQSMQVGQLVDVARMRNTLRIDFANSGPNVTVNHTPNGQLAIAR